MVVSRKNTSKFLKGKGCGERETFSKKFPFPRKNIPLPIKTNMQKIIYTTEQLPVAVTYPAEYFSVKDTLECGQIFRYYDLGEGYYGVFSGDKYAQLHTDGDTVAVQTEWGEYFADFFALDTDYSQTVARISAISHLMKQAAECGKGIRILRQDPTEMLFCFMISANNNIKRIQQIVERLCAGAGTLTKYGYAFPTAEQLAAKDAAFFSSLGAGYRDKFLYEAAQGICNFDVAALKNVDTETARKRLLEVKGVGPKVADCILLFGLQHGDVFPVDTWLKKVYHNYFETGLPDSAISPYFCKLFGQDSGLCQQYLFYFQRKYRQNEINNV